MSMQALEVLTAVEISETGDLSELVPPALTVTINNSPIYQAPDMIEFIVSGGQPETEALVEIDGSPQMTIVLDTDGGISLAAVSLSTDLGTVGTHELRVSQETIAGEVYGVAEFEVLVAPVSLPSAPTLDGSPFLPVGAVVPGRTVQRWVLQDPRPGGIGSYVLPVNPREMTSPHFERKLTSRRTMLAPHLGGRFHVMESVPQPKEWSFTGVTISEEMAEKFLEFRHLNRRFWVIDHRNRAWKCVFTNVDISPQLRKLLAVEGHLAEYTDWVQDYTVSALILDQTPVTPA